MSDSSLVTFVGEEIQNEDRMQKWRTFVDGKDGFLYGIPYQARRVAKFNPLDKSMELIGPDLGRYALCKCGVLAKNGCIYCPPCHYRNNDTDWKMLKINTQDGTVVPLHIEEERWGAGVLGADDCIYYMPSDRYSVIKHILRVDPHTDTLSYIRVSCSGFVGSVLGTDNCIYGLANNTSLDLCVMRFDPMEPENISYFGNDEQKSLNQFDTDGVLGNDGHIYALNKNGQVLKVDTSARTVDLIGEGLHKCGSAHPIIGLDQCIYWPPAQNTKGVLKFDPVTQQPPSYAGSDIILNWDNEEWIGGALASDGVIYCAPFFSNRVLAIDPLRELSMTMKKKMILYPDELGRLFVQNNESYSESLFGSAVRKFGFARALCLLDECLPSEDEVTEHQCSSDSVPLFVLDAASGEMKRKRSSDSVPLFVLAASGGRNVGDVPLSVIYHLVRRNVHGLLIS
jgi:hypothetical protein